MTSQTDPKTIELYGYGCQHEAVALGTITPGMLVERAAGGVQAHSSAGDVANTSFANEYALTGLTIDDDYLEDDRVIFNSYGPGAGIYALVAAGATAITEGALLASAGDGTLAIAGTDEVAVAQAMEAVDNSAGGSVARIRVEVINAARTAAA